MCFSVISMVAQLASNFSSFLSYCMRSLPVSSALQLSAADAGAANRKALEPMSAAASSVCLSFIVSLSVRDGGQSVRDAEPLVHDRARRRVLQELLLLRMQMMLDREGGQRRLVEAAQDQLLLAGIGVDVAHGIDAGHIGLEFLGVDLERFLLELETPLRDRPELRMQAEKHEQVIAVERHQRAIEALHGD